MKKRLLVAAIAIMVASFCANAFAQGPRKGQGMNPRRFSPDCSTLERLDLSSSQKEAILRIDSQYKGQILDRRNTLMLKRLELQGMLRDPHAGKDAIQARAREMGDAREEIQQKVIDYQVRIREVLTPEQIRRWCTMMGDASSHGGW